MIFAGFHSTFAEYRIAADGNTAYRIRSLRQSDDMRLIFGFQSPAGKRLYSSGNFTSDRDRQFGFGTVDAGEHKVIVFGQRGSGQYALALDVLATPEELLGAANVVAGGDTLSGWLAQGTFAEYTIVTRGGAEFRLRSARQPDDLTLRLRFDSPGGKRLYRSANFTTGRAQEFGFGTTEAGAHSLVVEGTRDAGQYRFELEELATGN